MYVDWTTEEMPRAFYVGEGTQKRVNGFKRNRVHAGMTARFGLKREIVKEFDDLWEARNFETELIIQHGTFAPVTGWGANLKLRDETPNGFKHTSESKAKLSAALKGRPKPPRTREHMLHLNEANRGKGHGPEWRRKMSEKLKGRSLSAAHKEALNKTMRTPEYKQNLSDSVRRAYASSDVRERISAAVKAAWVRRRAVQPVAETDSASTTSRSLVKQ